MHVQIICKSHKDLIKTKKATYAPDKVKYCVFGTQGQLTQKWPEFELFRDFMTVLSTCIFEEDSIKSQGTILRTTFTPL